MFPMAYGSENLELRSRRARARPAKSRSPRKKLVPSWATVQYFAAQATVEWH